MNNGFTPKPAKLMDHAWWNAAFLPLRLQYWEKFRYEIHPCISPHGTAYGCSNLFPINLSMDTPLYTI